MVRTIVENEFQRMLEIARPKYLMEKLKDIPETANAKTPKRRSPRWFVIVHSLIMMEDMTSMIAVREMKSHFIGVFLYKKYSNDMSVGSRTKSM